jgi:predicted extracellular nuclease
MNPVTPGPPLGARVRVQGVYVHLTRNVSPRSFWAQTPNSAAPYNGLYVFLSTQSPPPLPDRGQYATVEGEFADFNGLLEVVADTVTTVGTGIPPQPALDIDLSQPELDFAPYLGMLVAVSDVVVIDPNPDGPEDDFGNFVVEDTSPMGTAIIINQDAYTFPLAPMVNDTISYVRGIIHYTLGEYRLLPRDANDVVVN